MGHLPEGNCPQPRRAPSHLTSGNGPTSTSGPTRPTLTTLGLGLTLLCPWAATRGTDWKDPAGRGLGLGATPGGEDRADRPQAAASHKASAARPRHTREPEALTTKGRPTYPVLL